MIHSLLPYDDTKIAFRAILIHSNYQHFVDKSISKLISKQLCFRENVDKTVNGQKVDILLFLIYLKILKQSFPSEPQCQQKTDNNRR